MRTRCKYEKFEADAFTCVHAKGELRNREGDRTGEKNESERAREREKSYSSHFCIKKFIPEKETHGPRLRARLLTARSWSISL